MVSQEAVNALKALSTEDLREMNHVVCGLINDRITEKQQKAMEEFRMHEVVTFEKDYRTIRLKITSLNTKSISGYEVDSRGIGVIPERRWRVAPTHLKHLPEGVAV